jgi:hypothetical protein
LVGWQHHHLYGFIPTQRWFQARQHPPSLIQPTSTPFDNRIGIIHLHSSRSYFARVLHLRARASLNFARVFHLRARASLAPFWL